jgi:hypothetical protein
MNNKKHLITIGFLALLASCTSQEKPVVVQPVVENVPVVEPSAQTTPTLSPEETHQKLVTEKPVTESTTPPAETIAAKEEEVRQGKLKDLNYKLDLINAKYADLSAAAEQEYHQSIQANNQSYMNGQITPGQSDYSKDLARINMLEKQSEYQKALVSESNLLVNASTEAKDLYNKYNIPSNAGAATLKAVANQIGRN